MTEKIKALLLLSGGLDSTIALDLMLEQGIDVTGIKYTSPFCNCDQKGRCFAKEIAEKNKIPFKMLSKGEDYLDVIRKPKHGYGKGINPCIDCRIYMLKKTWEIAEETGAKFIITGDVLGQRPMSQLKRALKIIDQESSLAGKILRPLSAHLLPETEPERMGWVDRKKLLSINGRSRKEQLGHAAKKSIDIFSCAAGGCLLTEKVYAKKARDLFKRKEKINWNDMILLKVGRHFRFNKSKIVVGRNDNENNIILSRKEQKDITFHVPDHGSPASILSDEKNAESIEFAASLTALYSDCNDDNVLVKYGSDDFDNYITVNQAPRELAEKYNLAIM